MDSTKLLEEMRGRAKKMVQDYEDSEGNGIDQDEAFQLAQDVTKLHNWIAKGGALPAQWKDP